MLSGLGPFLPEPAAFGSYFSKILIPFSRLCPWFTTWDFFFPLPDTRTFALTIPPTWTFETDISWFR